MSFLKRLFGGGTTATGSVTDRDAENSLSQIAFLVTEATVEPPEGETTDEQIEFLEKAKQGLQAGAQQRREFKQNMKDQMRALGVPDSGFDKMFVDPTDQKLPGWHSIAMLYDWDTMDGSYGIQVFQPFFQRVLPQELKQPAIVHFGDLIGFETLCAFLVRSRSPADLLYIASRFGPDFESVGLLPYATRFLRATKNDAHLIPRSFSLPISGELRGRRMTADPQAQINWICEAAVKDTPWNFSGN